jgi:hypothetical protein
VTITRERVADEEERNMGMQREPGARGGVVGSGVASGLTMGGAALLVHYWCTCAWLGGWAAFTVFMAG